MRIIFVNDDNVNVQFFVRIFVVATMALFSTLLTASSETSASTSSSIPTVIQLFTSKPIVFDDNTDLGAHAVLSYQAVEVSPPTPEGESTLFQQRRSKASPILTPNLGVWNCYISKNTLVDSLLKILGRCDWALLHDD